MRNWISVVLAIAMAACHPRYVPLEERGVGGSGGLDSIRTRILAAIAMRDYQHARDLLELAANMTEEEQARFGQMISAAERGLVPFLENALPHIFRAEDGHFPVDTAEARELIQTTVIEDNFVGLPTHGHSGTRAGISRRGRVSRRALEGTTYSGGLW